MDLPEDDRKIQPVPLPAVPEIPPSSPAKWIALALMIAAGLLMVASVVGGYLDYTSPFSVSLRKTITESMRDYTPSGSIDGLDAVGLPPEVSLPGSIIVRDTTLLAFGCVVAAWLVMVNRKPRSADAVGDATAAKEPMPIPPDSDAGPFFE